MPETDEERAARAPIVPERLALALVCVLYSAVALVAFDAVASPSIKAIDDRIASTTYLALLLIGGSVSLVGTLRRWPRLEAIGQFALAGDWFCFATLGLISSGTRAVAFSSFLYAFALMSLIVWWQQLGRVLVRAWFARLRVLRARRKAAR